MKHEDELRSLLALGREENRAGFPLQWRREGKKVAGLLCSYVPEELIHAAGMLPWRIIGTWGGGGTPLANAYRRPSTCLFCNHVLEALLRGELDFLDAVVATDWDQEMVRLWDVWKYLGKTPTTLILHVPRVDSGAGCRHFAEEVAGFCDSLEAVTGRRVSEEALRHSIAVYEKTRALVRRVYEMRKAAVPPLSGSEMLGLTMAASLMPKEEFNARLEALWPYLQERKAGLKQLHPRLLVSSDRLDNPGYMEVIEEAGCLVAMDDLDTAGRNFWRPVDISGARSREDLLEALARRYLMQPASPRMMNWQQQVSQVAEWARDFNVQGVLELPQMYSRPRQMRAPFFNRELEARGIPVMSFQREYHVSNVGQLRTRVGAFAEILRGKE